MTNEHQDDLPGFEPGGRVAAEPAPRRRKSSSTRLRVIEASNLITQDKPQNIVFQHTVLCQTCLPYRDPGDQVRVWDRTNGLVALRVKAGEAMHPQKGWVDLGIPFGPKPRLILCYLNTQAIIRQSPVIEVEDSLTSFVKRVGFDPHGRNIRVIKEQLARLSAADLRFGVPTSSETARTFSGKVVTDFELWFPKNEQQRVFWPTTVTLSLDYFETLQRHAVPLDERALAALGHSAMALDIYAWLAQRLHRIDYGREALIPWAGRGGSSLMEQFGFGYRNLPKFRQVFKVALEQVLAVYPDAKVQLDGQGMKARHSLPPVLRRLSLIPKRA